MSLNKVKASKSFFSARWSHLIRRVIIYVIALLILAALLSLALFIDISTSRDSYSLRTLYLFVSLLSIIFVLITVTRIDLKFYTPRRRPVPLDYHDVRRSLLRRGIASLILTTLLFLIFLWKFPERYFYPQLMNVFPYGDLINYFRIPAWMIYSRPFTFCLIVNGFIVSALAGQLALRLVGFKWQIPFLRNMGLLRWVLILLITSLVFIWIGIEGLRAYVNIVGGVLLLAGALWTLPKWQAGQVKGLKRGKEAFDVENEARKTIAQVIGGAVILIGLYFSAQNLTQSQRSLEVTREGQLTERFTKAIELLGKPKQKEDEDTLVNRLGGIHALERIAKYNQSEHWTIMEVLTAYLREHASVAKYELAKRKFEEGEKLNSQRPEFRWPPPDIQEILLVIGRREWRDTEMESLYLSKTALGGSETPLGGAHMERAIMFDANLEDGYLRGAYLISANLAGANLSGANLEESQLMFSNLRGVNLKRASLKYADLRGADLEGADLEGTDLEGANLESAKGFSREQVKVSLNFDKAKPPLIIIE